MGAANLIESCAIEEQKARFLADANFYRGKLQAARYFLTWEVPACHHGLALLETRDDTCLAMQDAWF